MKRLSLLLAFPVLALVLGCTAGNSTPQAPAAQAMTYTDPVTTPSDWKLVKDPSSTPTRLVLDLVGPSDGTRYRGAGFTLRTDTTQVHYGRFPDYLGNPTAYHGDGGVFLDRDATGSWDVAPRLQASGIKGDRLMVGIFQDTDDQAWSLAWGSPIDGAKARTCSTVVLRIALELDASAHPGTVALELLKARAIPENVGTVVDRKMVAIPVKVGVLDLK